MLPATNLNIGVFVKEGKAEKPVPAYSLGHHAGWAAYRPHLPDWLRAFASHMAAQAGASLRASLPTEQHRLPPTGHSTGSPIIRLLPPRARGSCTLIGRVFLPGFAFLPSFKPLYHFSASLSSCFCTSVRLAQAKLGSESKTFADLANLPSSALYMPFLLNIKFKISALIFKALSGLSSAYLWNDAELCEGGSYSSTSLVPTVTQKNWMCARDWTFPASNTKTNAY